MVTEGSAHFPEERHNVLKSPEESSNQRSQEAEVLTRIDHIKDTFF